MDFGLKEVILKQIREVIKDNSFCQFKMFGSRARGDYKETSDIDIAVFGKISKEQEYKIRNEIDLLDIIYKVDLVFVNENTRKELLESIKRDGVEL